MTRNPWRRAGSATVRIDAPPAVVYARITDITATGDRSLECRTAAWLPGAQPGTVGARFRGRNRSGVARWSRVCEVIDARPAVAFAFRTVPSTFDPTRADSTIWRYSLQPDGAGTVTTHDYEIVTLPLAPFRAVYGRLLPHHRDMRPHLAHTLDALKRAIETGEEQ